MTSVSPGDAGGDEIRLGRVGQMFTTTILGQSAAPIPPNGWLAGFAVGVVHPSDVWKPDRADDRFKPRLERATGIEPV